MPDQPHLRGLLEWSLAAFHAGFLFAGIVALLYAGGALGALLGSLNTLLGLGLYAIFWLTTWWTTRRAMQGFAWSVMEQPAALLGRLWAVALWAGINGLLLFGAVFVVITVNVLALVVAGRSQPGELLSFVFAVGVAGTAVAAVVGMVAGVFLALVDACLLALARWLVPAPEAPL